MIKQESLKLESNDFMYYKILLSIYIIFYFIPIGLAIEGFCVFGLLLLTYNKIFNQNKNFDKSILKDRMFILIILFSLFQLVSSIFAYDALDALYQYRKDFLFPLLVGFTIIVFYKAINFLYIYKTMTLTLLAVGVWYFYETYEIFGHLNFTDYSFQTPRDATFTIPILFPFVIFGLYEFYKNKFYSFIALIAMTLAILLVVYSGSRGAVLAFSTEIVVFILFTILSRNWKYILFPILFSIVVFYVFTNNIIAQKFHDATKKGIDPNGRITTVTNFQQPALDHLFFGVGIGKQNTAIVIEQYQFKKHFGLDKDGVLIAGPHNTFLKILYQNGIFALICYILIIVIVVSKTIKFKQHVNTLQGKLAFALVTVFLDHFVLRGSVEDLKIGKFYLIVFIAIALYNTTLKSNHENSIHIS